MTGEAVPDYACLAKEQADARTATYGILKCVSLSPDCNHPIISLRQTDPDERLEFDLITVLDANGHGPTFEYYSQPVVGTFIPDEQLADACHTMCDTPSTASSWSCHNLDLCGEDALQRKAATICDGIGNRS